MDTMQSKEVEIPDLEENLKILNSLESEFNISYLQAKLDYNFLNNKQEKFSDLQLGIIVIDKLLKLKFPDQYIALIDKKMFLLNNVEKQIFKKEKQIFKNPSNPEKYTSVKIVFTYVEKNKKYSFEIGDSTYILYLIDNKNLNIMVRFICNQLEKYEK